jgi:putative ABC transport system ATP-binding protein
VSAAPTGGLVARDLYRFFRAGEEETLALRGVSLHVGPGETVAVVGPSGSGKTTLLSCLAGLDEPAGGSVLVCGHRLSHRPETERATIRARCIGVLLQSDNLLAHLRLRENVVLAQGARHREDRRRAEQLLDSVGLSHRTHAYPAQLSGGELARAGLAVALANDPSVLLADEPTGELDGSTERAVLDLLARSAAGRRAVLVVTHSRAVTASADRVIELRDGQVC